MKTPNFEKGFNNLLPAIVQDVYTKSVLMLGYMNEEAWTQTLASGQVTFFSRSKQRLWTKGEQSGNYLTFVSGSLDCDSDTFLIQAKPTGPVCHRGTDTCWEVENKAPWSFISELEAIIASRKETLQPNSYVSQLFAKGINKIAQKVGEEAVETVIEAKDNNSELFLNESADLLFHYLILLQAKGYQLNDVLKILESRNK